MNNDTFRGQSWVAQRICDRKEGVGQGGLEWAGKVLYMSFDPASLGMIYCTTYQWCKVEPRNEEEVHFPAIPASHVLWRVLPKIWSRLIKMLRRLAQSVCQSPSLKTSVWQRACLQRAVSSQLAPSPAGQKGKDRDRFSLLSFVTWCSPKSVWVWLLLI